MRTWRESSRSSAPRTRGQHYRLYGGRARAPCLSGSGTHLWLQLAEVRTFEARPGRELQMAFDALPDGETLEEYRRGVTRELHSEIAEMRKTL